MNSTGMRSLFVIAGIAAFVTVGCGKGSPLSASGSPGSIIGPTLLMADGEVEAAAASASGEFATLGKGGNGKGGGNAGAEDSDKGNKDKKPKGADDDADVEDDEDEDSEGPGHRGHGSLSGFVTAVGTNTITVRGVVVTVTSATIIRHGHRELTLADITVGDHVQVKGTSTTTGTATTFTATEIKVEDKDGKEGEDDDGVGGSELEGAIAGQTGTCPALTFTIGTKTVKTNASTTFDDGVCTDLANGKTVEVTGTTQADGSILATKVDLEDASETEGAISGLTGTCPALTFAVAAKTVKTNASTTFEGVACTALLNGSVVELKGTAQADGSILATNVELD